MNNDNSILENLDNEIIELICHKVFAKYTFNEELLHNWQVELVDELENRLQLNSIIEEEIIICIPSDPVPDIEMLIMLFERLFGLEDEYYQDFKIIILELITILLSTSYKTKIALYRMGILDFLVKEFLSLLLHTLPTQNQSMKLILIFSDLGFDLKLLKLLIDELFLNEFESFKKLNVLELLNQLFHNYSCHFKIHLFNSRYPISIPFNNTSNSKLLTIHSWIKVNRLSGPTDELLSIFTLSDSFDSEETTLQIHLYNYNQFVVEIRNRSKNARMRYSFNQLLKYSDTDNQNFVHFALTYDSYTNLNLYIDGEYSESIPCPDIKKWLHSWNKINIGNYSNDIICNDEILLRNVNLLNIDLSYEWINLIFNLGPAFNWEFFDNSNENILHILSFLNPKALANVRLKFNELQKAKKREKIDIIKLQVPENIKVSSAPHLIDMNMISSYLASHKIAKDNIIFDLEYYSNSEGDYNNSMLVHSAGSLYSSFYSICGTSLFLKMIEYAMKIDDPEVRDSYFSKSISSLFYILNNDWRLNKEFENINGYGILLILLNKYKEYNGSLSLNISSKYDLSNDGNPIIDVLSLLLINSDADSSDPRECLIINSTIYRILIFNFDLFFQTPSFKLLLNHLVDLLEVSKYRLFNKNELQKMKLLKKIIQFLKQPILKNTEIDNDVKEALMRALKAIILSDSSVESIRSVSHYIIYALFQNDCSQDIGIITLKALTSIICDPDSSLKLVKKFSRVFSIHWILLLFNPKLPNEVAKYGIKLLTKLLKVLGTNITKRFFYESHGLEVITYFLMTRWSDDGTLSLIFDSSLNTKDDMTCHSNLISSVSNINPSSIVIMPELLIILNNLVLSSMSQLSNAWGMSLESNPSSPKRGSSISPFETFSEVKHLINEYNEFIEKGSAKNKSLKEMFNRKEWIDSIFEYLGYLKLSLTWKNISTQDIKCTFDKLIEILSDMFLSNFHSLMIETFSTLNDFTKKLMFELIFPNIFERITISISEDAFILDDGKFFQTATEMLNVYYFEFICQNYQISFEKLNTYVICIFSVLEVDNRKKITGGTKRLKKILGDLIILQFLRLDGTSETSKMYNTILRNLLYRQVVVLNDNLLDTMKFGRIITLILGILMRLTQEEQYLNIEYTFNFLRSCYLTNQDRFDDIINSIDSEQSTLLTEFFEDILTRNNEESLGRLYKIPTLLRVFSTQYQRMINKSNKLDLINIDNIISITLNGGKPHFMNNVYTWNFERDCENLKQLIIQMESIKFKRLLQDHEENIQFYVSNYNSLKIDLTRLIESKNIKHHYILDYIENIDRMRKRLVIEEQLEESEKLSYHIDIPLKMEHLSDDLENYNLIRTAEEIGSILINEDANLIDQYENIGVLDELNDNDNDTDTDFENEHSNIYEDKNRKVIRSLYMGDQIISIWNISQINGLVPIESIMILGRSHLYLIENYLHSTNGNVVDVDDAPSELRDPYLQLINSQSKNILKGDNRSHRSKNWRLNKLSCLSRRQFLLRDTALEMFFSDGASILITCLSTKDRDSIHNKLSAYALGHGLDYDLTQALRSSSMWNTSSIADSASYLTSKIASAFSSGTLSSVVAATKKWRSGSMSNFYYLMIINTLSGRTFNDLTQYPVFPWIIADYKSEALDLSNPNTFRDLSKPMGAQSQPRADQFKERYDALLSLEDPTSPPFHYGTHYSSAMIVTSFLIRLKPYVQSYLLLQGGNFDHADRLFNSIEKAWLSASRDNTTDVRELTPEFFYLPEFLQNKNNFEFGTQQNGKPSNDVELPPWAHGDPKIFIAKNREALESPYVSANLHLWIELIFGQKQTGIEAVNSLNIFHHFSYKGAIDLDHIDDEIEKKAIIGMINNFGQTPSKIFHKPHPIKEVVNLPNNNLLPIDKTRAPELIFESKLKMPIEKLEFNVTSNKWVGRPSCVSYEDEILIRKPKFKGNCGSLIINKSYFLDIHLSNITALMQVEKDIFLTGSEDGLINVWKFHSNSSNTLQFQSILRGHIAPIVTFSCSKSLKICISNDTDGILMFWDLSRYKFIRKITPPPIDEEFSVITSISEDSGIVGIIYSTSTTNILTLRTVNGELILRKTLRPIRVTALTFGTSSTISSESYKELGNYRHIHWSNEILAIAYGKDVDILKLSYETGWELSVLDELETKYYSNKEITTMKLLEQVKIDPHEQLSRGSLKLIFGDSVGRVYNW